MRRDPARLAALKDLLVLDTAPEATYDDLTLTLAQRFDVPIAMVNLLDAERDWFKSCIGLPFEDSPADTSFCEVLFGSDDDVIVIEDTTQDERFCKHPLVTGAPHVRFYASARLTVDGHTVGTLCVYDTTAKEVTASQVADLRVLGRAAMEMLRHRQPARSG